MIKLFSTLLLLGTLSFANMVNGIALTVNEDPITVFDINNKMATKKLSKKDAVSQLMDEVLYDQEIIKQNVSVDIFDINNYLEKVAASNGMDLYTFKSIIKQKYKDYSVFEDETKRQILREKLIQKLVRGNLAIANDEDIKRYYDNNREIFTTSSSINAIEYTSKNKRLLKAAKNNPMLADNNLQKRSVVLQQSSLNPQLKYVINSTKVQTFTPIFTANKHFVMFYVSEKSGVTSLSFEEVKQRIFNVIMKEREQTFLKDYFEKLKLTADIKIIR